jgi:hypothetical protein
VFGASGVYAGKDQNISKQYLSMAFRVSNAIIVAGTSIDSATIRSLPLGHAPSPRGPSGSAFQYNVQLMFRFSAILDRRHQELYIYIPLIAASADETALR